MSRKGRREKQRFFCLWRNKRDTFFVFGGTRKVQLLCEWKRYATIFFFFFHLSTTYQGREEERDETLFSSEEEEKCSLSGKGKRNRAAYLAREKEKDVTLFV